jgi:MFS family permease
MSHNQTETADPIDDTPVSAAPCAPGASAVAMRVRGDWLDLPRTYWLLWSGVLLNRLGGSVFFLLSIYLTRERGLSPELAGLVISLYAAGAMLSGPAGGVLADRIGRRATLLLSTGGGGALMLAFGFVRTRGVGALAVLAPLLGFFSDLCRPPLQAAVTDVVPPDGRRRAYAFLYWAINLGFGGAAIVGGALAEHHFLLLFVIDGLTTFAYGAIVFAGVPETRPLVVPAQPQPSSTPSLAALIAPFHDRRFMSFLLIQLLLLVAFSQVVVALPLDMRNHGLSTMQIGWLLGLNGLVIVIAQPIALRFVRGLDHVQWLAAGSALTGFGLGAMALAAGGPLVYAAATVLWTLGEIGFSTAAPAIVADLSPIDRRGAYQGTFQLAWGVASMIAPLVGPPVLARAGGPALWIGCLVACLAAAALHLRRRGRST